MYIVSSEIDSSFDALITRLMYACLLPALRWFLYVYCGFEGGSGGSLKLGAAC